MEKCFLLFFCAIVLKGAFLPCVHLIIRKRAVDKPPLPEEEARLLQLGVTCRSRTGPDRVMRYHVPQRSRQPKARNEPAKACHAPVYAHGIFVELAYPRGKLAEYEVPPGMVPAFINNAFILEKCPDFIFRIRHILVPRQALHKNARFKVSLYVLFRLKTHLGVPFFYKIRERRNLRGRQNSCGPFEITQPVFFIVSTYKLESVFIYVLLYYGARPGA